MNNPLVAASGSLASLQTATTPSSGIHKRAACGYVVLALVVFASPVRAQEIVDVQVGFKPLSKNAPTHKVGFWTPVTVRLKGPPDGAPAEYSLAVETDDSEDSSVITRLDVSLAPGEEKTITVDVKPGRTRGDVRVTLSTKEGRRIARASVSSNAGELGDYLYLVLGNPIDALPDALDFREKRAADEGKSVGRLVRFAVGQNGPPTRLGCDGIDLVIASGGWSSSDLSPVMDWVERGGRLVVAVDPDKFEPLLSRPGAEPRTPRAPFLAKNLAPIEAWAGLQNKPFPARGEPPVKIARLDPADFGFPSWDVLAKLEDKSAGNQPLPLIARASYGFGSVTVVAFPLDAGAFVRWSGQTEFLRALVDQIGPRYVPAEKAKDAGWRPEASADDWGATLQRDLDNFDVPAWSFGAVAVALLAYVVLVSAGDYFLLRRVLGRFEATWITLPLLVAGVSIAAFCGLGSDDRFVRVNQISLLDFDCRWAETGLEKKALCHGSTFFTLRGDAIRRFDVAVEAGEKTEGGQDAPTTVSWFGRADDGPAGIGRVGGHGFSSKGYDSPMGHASLVGVPFAYHATKTFTGVWLAAPTCPDLYAWNTRLSGKLVYHPRDSQFKVTGTVVNRLPFDLEDASLIVFDRVYPLGEIKKDEAKSVAIKEIDPGLLPSNWIAQPNPDRPVTPQGKYDPGAALKNIMFHERLDSSLKIRDHLLRRLDWSWRLRDDPRVLNVPLSTLGVRDAILVGHAKFESGSIGELQTESTPARIVIGDDHAKLSRDTYVRAIIPMRPQQ